MNACAELFRQPGADDRARLRLDLPAADRGDPLGAGDRQERQRGNALALRRRADAASHVAALGEERLSAYINRIGLYNTKARNVIATCRLLVEHHGGEVPNDRQALEALPGVGRKTANVVLNTAFGEPTIAVDTHIFRVANRTRLAVGKDAARRRTTADQNGSRRI